MLDVRRDLRHELDGRRTGPDDADALAALGEGDGDAAGVVAKLLGWSDGTFTFLDDVVLPEGASPLDIASVIGRRLGLPVESVPVATYGPLGPIFATDQPSSSTHTREALGWEPTHPSLLEDLENIQP